MTGPIVTDAMLKAGREATLATNIDPLSDAAFIAIYTAMRSMEAKPDPEGLIERDAVLQLLDDSVERWRPMGGGPLYIEGYEIGVADACSFLAEDIRRGPPYPTVTASAKPSLEPTRTELVEALATVLAVADLYRDVLGSECLAKLEAPRAILSRKQSGGGNG